MCPLVEVIPLLLTLSNGCCFTCMPKTFERVVDITWLRCSPRFTLAQYVAGIIELAVWRSWHNPRAKLVSSSRIQQMRHAVLSVLNSTRSRKSTCLNSNIYMTKSLASKEVIRSVRDVFDSDDGKVAALVSVMKQRLKRSQTYSVGFGREQIQNL